MQMHRVVPKMKRRNCSYTVSKHKSKFHTNVAWKAIASSNFHLILLFSIH